MAPKDYLPLGNSHSPTSHGTKDRHTAPAGQEHRLMLVWMAWGSFILHPCIPRFWSNHMVFASAPRKRRAQKKSFWTASWLESISAIVKMMLGTSIPVFLALYAETRHMGSALIPILNIVKTTLITGTRHSTQGKTRRDLRLQKNDLTFAPELMKTSVFIICIVYYSIIHDIFKHT